MKTYKKYLIEALPIHKEICTFLIDNKVTFKCYNGGLKAIVIDCFGPYKKDDFMNEIINKFNLILNRETKDYYEYKQAE